jgi:hypothetical protein
VLTAVCPGELLAQVQTNTSMIFIANRPNSRRRDVALISIAADGALLISNSCWPETQGIEGIFIGGETARDSQSRWVSLSFLASGGARLLASYRKSGQAGEYRIQ